MQQTGKGLVTLDLYSVPDEAECLEDQVQFMIFAGSAGNSIPENVRSPIRPQPPGISTEDGEMTFSIETMVPGADQSGPGARSVGARSQLRADFWIDGLNPDAPLSVEVAADAGTAQVAPAAALDPERSLRPGPPSVDGPVLAISDDLPGRFDPEPLQGSTIETSPPRGLPAVPLGQPQGPLAINIPPQQTGASEKTPGGVRPSALPPAPSLAMTAASLSQPEVGAIVPPPGAKAALALGTPDDAAEKPAPRIQLPSGQAMTATNEAPGEGPPRMLRSDTAVARPTPLPGTQAMVSDMSADVAQGSDLFVSKPTRESLVQDPRLSPAAPASGDGSETVLSGTRVPADRIGPDSKAAFAAQINQPKSGPSAILTDLGNPVTQDNRLTAESVGNDDSGVLDRPAAMKIGDALAFREAQASREVPVPATAASSPKGMTRNADVSQTSRSPAEGAGALISKAPIAEVVSGIQASADPSAQAASDVFLDTMDAGQSGQSSLGDSLRRTPEPEIRLATLARGATSQIAEAVRLPLDGSIEVRLSPEELGRVRVSMIPGEAGLVIQLVAERPETLELLRRHADLLAADLQDAGYTGLEFSFSREDRGHDRSDAGPGPRTDPTIEKTAIQAAAPQGVARSVADGTLDLRL
jgi:hypothetical protein